MRVTLLEKEVVGITLIYIIKLEVILVYMAEVVEKKEKLHNWPGKKYRSW